MLGAQHRRCIEMPARDEAFDNPFILHEFDVADAVVEYEADLRCFICAEFLHELHLVVVYFFDGVRGRCQVAENTSLWEVQFFLDIVDLCRRTEQENILDIFMLCKEALVDQQIV